MNDIAKLNAKLKQLNEGLNDMALNVDRDHEVQMARADLYKMAEYAMKLHEMLGNVSEAEGLQGWVQAKITKASDYLSSVYHSLEHEKATDPNSVLDPDGDPEPSANLPEPTEPVEPQLDLELEPEMGMDAGPEPEEELPVKKVEPTNLYGSRIDRIKALEQRSKFADWSK